MCLQGKAVEQSLLCNGETSTSKGGECLHLSPDLIWMKDRLRWRRTLLLFVETRRDSFLDSSAIPVAKRLLSRYPRGRNVRWSLLLDVGSRRCTCSSSVIFPPPIALLLGGRYGTTVVDGYQIFATTLFLNATASRYASLARCVKTYLSIRSVHSASDDYKQFLDALKTRLETNYTVLRPSSPTLHALFVVR